MPKRGRRTASTREQREQVLRLVGEGCSRRAVAEKVFGNARLRGRVDRIVRRAELEGRCPEIEQLDEGLVSRLADAAGAEGSPSLEDLVAVYARRLQRRLDDPEDWVSAGELLAFARLGQWLENTKLVEEANRLTRDA